MPNNSSLLIPNSSLTCHAVEQVSEANGPGKRFVIWLQGCNLACNGCFNPQTHDFNGGYQISVTELFEQIIQTPNIEGISISGGEPLLQAENLLKLTTRIKQETKLSILLFTGFGIDEIETENTKKAILNCCDIIIAGRYQNENLCFESLKSSSNQKIIFNTDRYSQKDLQNISSTEIIIDQNGNITLTGMRN